MGATVQVKDVAAATATTAADGTVTVAKVPVTATVLEVRAEGYAPVDIQLKAGRAPTVFAATLVKQLPPAPPPTRSITGLVRDSATGKVLAGATVKVQGTELAAQSDADGYFALSGVAAADVVLEVSAADFGTAAVAVPAQEGSAKIALTSTAPAPLEAPKTRALRGKLTDGNNEPVIGAVVKVVGGEQSALTDENGVFQLDNLPLAEIIIEASAESYELKRIIALPTVAEVTAILKESTTGEVVFIEGRAPAILKSNAASSSSVVKSQDLTRVTSQTVEGSLSGKIAGANIQSNSGAPGGGMQIRLRGISTINGQSSPLYVIDGVVISNRSIPSGINAITAATAGGNASTANGNGSVQDNPSNRVADLNPNDIENVEVLKGSSAAALYGSKASNGVIIITTKRGRSGKTKVNLTQRFGFAQVSNTLGQRRFTSKEEVTAAFDPKGENALDDTYTGAYYDHEKELQQTKLATETVATLSGGNDTANYFGSVLVRNEPGVIKNTFYDKQSGRVAVGYDFGRRARFNFSGNLIHSKSDRGLTNNDNTGTSYYVALASTPSFLNLKPSSMGIYPDNPFAASNPLQTVNRFKNEEELYRGIGSVDGAFKVHSDKEHIVTVQSTFGVDWFHQYNDLFSPPDLQFEEQGGTFGRSIEASNESLSANFNLSGTWRYTPKSNKFQSALQVGTTYEYVNGDSVTAIGTTLTAGQESVDSAVSLIAQEALIRTKDQGLYLQEELGLLDNNLTLLGGVLAERSSLNGNVDKLFVFPKLAATYSLPNLPKQLESLRVRGGYGETGNRPNFAWKFTQLNTVTIGGQPAVVTQGTVGDPDTEPERQREIELGTDIVLKDQLAVVELSVYQRDISNVLLNRTLPGSSGFTFENLSGGEFRNRGIEASVQVTPLDGALQWVARGTFTLNRSKVLELPNGNPFIVTGAGFGAGLGAFRIEEGQSATQIVVSDYDGDGKLNKVGDGEPDFRVGLSNNFTYKNFGLSSLIDWQQGSEIVNLTRLLYDFGQVTEDYVGAGEARLESFNNGNPSPYIEDATFVKLREVALTYNVPKDIISKLVALDSLQVSLSGRNLLTFTNYSGLDPEVSNFGNQPVGRNYDVAPYPPSRSYWLSLDASF